LQGLSKFQLTVQQWNAKEANMMFEKSEKQLQALCKKILNHLK
jgi:hypothetical protein